MALARTFPRAQPHEQIGWLDEHAAYGTDQEDEVRYVQIMVALVSVADKFKPLKCELPVTLDGSLATIPCSFALAFRTLHACTLVLKEWSDTSSWVVRRRLQRLLGVVKWIVETAPFFQSSSFALKEETTYSGLLVMKVVLPAAIEWANQMTGFADPEAIPPMAVDVKHTPKIDWRVQAFALQGKYRYSMGQYSEARRLFRRAVVEYQWIPSEQIQIFLDSPAQLYTDDASQLASAAAAVASSPMSPLPLAERIDYSIDPFDCVDRFARV